MQEELEVAALLMDRLTEFGYSPEKQDFRGLIKVKEFTGTSRNIVLELPGRGEGVVILGAHYDTTPDSVGANASGIGVLLALAERLARSPWSNQAVRLFELIRDPDVIFGVRNKRLLVVAISATNALEATR